MSDPGAGASRARGGRACSGSRQTAHTGFIQSLSRRIVVLPRQESHLAVEGEHRPLILVRIARVWKQLLPAAFVVFYELQLRAALLAAAGLPASSSSNPHRSLVDELVDIGTLLRAAPISSGDHSPAIMPDVHGFQISITLSLSFDRAGDQPLDEIALPEQVEQQHRNACHQHAHHGHGHIVVVARAKDGDPHH